MSESQVDTVKLLERVVKVETEVTGLRSQQKAHAERTDKRFDDQSAKIDKIIQMLSAGKGMGAVLATLGAASVSGITAMIVYYFTKGQGQ